MQEHETKDCQDLISYMIGECSELERAAFERHLRTCSACREELLELQTVWDALPFEMDEIEAPTDLKNEVMQAIHALPQTKSQINRSTTAQDVHAIQQKRVRNFVVKFGWIAAILVGVIIGGLWSKTFFDKPTTLAGSLLNQPAEVLRTFDLKAADSSMPTAKGTAWVLKHGDTNNVVVNLQGLKKTKGDWTYQVWLVSKGSDNTTKRYNCGTLNVDDKGNGVLTYPINAKFIGFDAVGVTLEADANGNQPRGKKVLGT
jgi:F0F1-type ATP synthase assembly protein I